MAFTAALAATSLDCLAARLAGPAGAQTEEALRRISSAALDNLGRGDAVELLNRG